MAPSPFFTAAGLASCCLGSWAVAFWPAEDPQAAARAAAVATVNENNLRMITSKSIQSARVRCDVLIRKTVR